MLNKRLFILFLISLFCLPSQSFAAPPPPTSQQASGQTGLSEQQERERKLREKIEQPLPKVENAAGSPAPTTTGCRQSKNPD